MRLGRGLAGRGLALGVAALLLSAGGAANAASKETAKPSVTDEQARRAIEANQRAADRNAEALQRSIEQSRRQRNDDLTRSSDSIYDRQRRAQDQQLRLFQRR